MAMSAPITADRLTGLAAFDREQALERFRRERVHAERVERLRWIDDRVAGGQRR
jgi:hypothetical protein